MHDMICDARLCFFFDLIELVTIVLKGQTRGRGS